MTKEKQIKKLALLMGVDQLNEDTQSAVETLLMEIINEDDFDRVKSSMDSLLEYIGADKLPTETQNSLIEKTLDVLQFIRDVDEKGFHEQAENYKVFVSDFKWNNYSTPPKTINEINKSDFKWEKNPGSAFGMNENSEIKKVSKDNYRWSADKNSMGSTIKENKSCQDT